MTKYQIKQLNEDFEMAYKQLMIPLYKHYGDIDSAVIRLMFVKFVENHNHKKLLELVNKRKHRKLKYRKVIRELDTIKIKQRLDNPFEEEKI